MPDGKARQLHFVMEAKSVITFPSGGQPLPARGSTRSGAWPGRAAAGSDGSRSRPTAAGTGGMPPPGAGPPLRPHPLPPRLAMGRARGRPPVALHRRDRLRPADAGRAGQGPRPQLDLLQQRHPELEGGGRRECPQCARVGAGDGVVLVVAGVGSAAQLPTYGVGRRRPRRRSGRGTSPSPDGQGLPPGRGTARSGR